ncbi:MAG: hypothetical protein ACP5GK_08780 [Desulfurella sp.]|uniref:hypothetical protein n=1 Tax=Desulfurella sp. TaxID=1962857 RepID=UPI003D132D4B
MLKKVLLSLAVIGFIYGQSFAVEKKPAPTPPPPHKCVICGKVVVTRGPCPQITCPRPIPGPVPKPKPNPKPIPNPNPHPGPKPHPGPQPQ